MKPTIRNLLRGVRRRLRPRYPTVRQYDQTDCGAASLLSVLRYHGGDASLVSVREQTHTGAHGTSMWSLKTAAESFGFDATGARGSLDDLREVALPCIAHLVLDDGRQHFVVVFRISGKKVLVGDPARGLRWLPEQSFSSQWKSRAVLLLSPTDALHRVPPPHWVSWIAAHFRREEVWLTQALFMGLVYAGLGLLTAVFVRALIDTYIPAGNARDIIVVGFSLLALQIVRGLVGYLRGWLLIELSRRVNTCMTADALAHLFHLPTSFFESRRAGDITARMNDSVRIHAAILNVLGNTAIDVVVVIGSLLLVFYFAPPLGWAAAIFITGLSLATWLAARRVRDRQFEVRKAHAGVQAAYIDTITAIEPIRATNSARFFAGLIGGMYRDAQKSLAGLAMVQNRVAVAVELAAGVLVVSALTAGSILVAGEQMSLGAVMAAYSLLATAFPATARIVDAHLQIQEASVASTRLLDLLLVAPEANVGRAPFRMSRHLAVRDGAFHWPGGDTLFENLELQVPRGRLTALCGPSGVGKSTIIKILDRRYRLDNGELLLDAAPADRIELRSYRRHVATLPEPVRIINGTIADNILLGRRVDDRHEITERIRQLGLAPFMDRFPMGPATLIGDEGRQISSGERQTIGLLRALWELPDVVLVDEGMNSIDAKSASLFLDVLKRYSETNAVLIVSHQPRALLGADYVYVLQQGRIAASGTPQELLAADSAFAALISNDFQGQPST